MRARGITYRAIGEKLGITNQRAGDIVLTYDPRGVFVGSPEIRQKLAYIDWQSIQAKAQQIALDKADDASVLNGLKTIDAECH